METYRRAPEKPSKYPEKKVMTKKIIMKPIEMKRDKTNYQVISRTMKRGY